MVWCVCHGHLCAVEDTLDSLLTGSDDEAEEDAVVSKILDEIGIEVNTKVWKVLEHVWARGNQ